MTGPDRSTQQEEWERLVEACHAKGQCEFSGLLVTDCVEFPCDCFETPEGAARIVAAATEPLVERREP